MKKLQPGRHDPKVKHLRVSHILRHNTAIVPASQLKAIRKWQAQANLLPEDSTLLVIPANNGRLNVVGHRIRLLLNYQGRRVTVTTIH